MRHLMFLLFVLVGSGNAFAATSPDTQAGRMEAAKRYIDSVDVQKMLNDSVEALSQGLPAESRERLKKLMLVHVRADVLSEAMLLVMVKTFTTQELDAMAAFYGSDVGKSVMSKFGVYMAQVTPLVQAEMQHAIAEARAEDQRRNRTNGS